MGRPSIESLPIFFCTFFKLFVVNLDVGNLALSKSSLLCCFDLLLQLGEFLTQFLDLAVHGVDEGVALLASSRCIGSKKWHRRDFLARNEPIIEKYSVSLHRLMNVRVWISQGKYYSSYTIIRYHHVMR